LPGGDEASVGGCALNRQDAADGAQQGDLLHPAAGEGIQWQHRTDESIAGQRSMPTLPIGCLFVAGTRTAGLVEQHDDRFADPFENGKFGRQVAHVRRFLGRVHQVQHDVSLFAHVAHRLLREPERAIAETIPDLRQEPADGVALLLQTPGQAGAVAESRGVPEQQFIAFRRADQGMAGGLEGDVRRVAHLADIAPEQGARERRLAGIGVRNQRQGDATRSRSGPPR
jgi:hypothetical protein